MDIEDKVLRKWVIWTDEETDQLVDAIRQQGWGKWREITQSLSGGGSCKQYEMQQIDWKSDIWNCTLRSSLTTSWS
jgi:hypothetical protein